MKSVATLFRYVITSSIFLFLQISDVMDADQTMNIHIIRCLLFPCDFAISSQKQTNGVILSSDESCYTILALTLRKSYCLL